MTILRVMTVGVMLLGVGACSAFGPDAPSIGGQYDLVSVTGSALPCCAAVDSTGTQVTIVGGSLTLADAAPEKFGATPAGYVPLACIHESSNGNDDQFPSCEEQHHASYVMIIARQYDDANGGSRTVSDTTSGVYAWSASGPAMVSLLGSGLGGPVSMSGSSAKITVYALDFGRGPEPGAPTYEFARVSR